jgi:hypothetical protein
MNGVPDDCKTIASRRVHCQDLFLFVAEKSSAMVGGASYFKKEMANKVYHMKVCPSESFLAT